MKLKNEPTTASGTADPMVGPELIDYWRILVERRAVVLACLAITISVVMLGTFLSTPIYRAATTLQIERQAPDVMTFQEVFGVDRLSYQDYHETQYRIIQSRTVLRIAAERLDLGNRPAFLNRPGSPLSRLFRWATSSSPEERVETPAVQGVGFLAAGLTVKPVRESHLVEISFTDRSPELARDAANAVADAYVYFNLESRYTTTEQASEFLTKEVARVQAEIGGLERELQEYGTEKAILALSNGTQDISEQALADLNSRLTDARGRLAVADARLQQLRNAPAESLPEVLGSTLINHLKEQYAELERQHSQMSGRFKADWPTLTQLERELQQARERIDAETASLAAQVRKRAKFEHDQAVAEAANLERQVGEQKQEVQRINRDAIEYAGLRAQIETRRKVLSDLVERQSETETSGQLRDARASNIRIVDRAETPGAPFRPRKALNLFVSVLLGLGLGIGVAILLHQIDNTIKSEQDIERYGGGAAVLAHVPVFEPLRVLYGGKKEAAAGERNASAESAKESSPDLASHQLPLSSFAEAFRNLRTSLLLASPNQPPRHILVTSCEPGAGKSTVALNLAIVLSQMGKKVLLVDADLRRPRLHRVFELSNDVGLSGFLTGHSDLEPMLHDPGVPMLRVITSGPTPPNPSELLGSPRLDHLFERLDDVERFDHILLDSPPAVQVADSVLLANRVDATLLVVRAGITSRESLAEGISRLRQARVRIAGALLNAVSERSGYYYYYHRRRYGSYYSRDGKTSGDERKRSRPGAGGALALFSRKHKESRRRAG